MYRINDKACFFRCWELDKTCKGYLLNVSHYRASSLKKVILYQIWLYKIFNLATFFFLYCYVFLWCLRSWCVRIKASVQQCRQSEGACVVLNSPGVAPCSPSGHAESHCAPRLIFLSCVCVCVCSHVHVGACVCVCLCCLYSPTPPHPSPPSHPKPQ